MENKKLGDGKKIKAKPVLSAVYLDSAIAQHCLLFFRGEIRGRFLT